MRITGGELKGRITKCPDGVIRPAMDRMRESVFAIFGDLSGNHVLWRFPEETAGGCGRGNGC